MRPNDTFRLLPSPTNYARGWGLDIVRRPWNFFMTCCFLHLTKKETIKVSIWQKYIETHKIIRIWGKWHKKRTWPDNSKKNNNKEIVKKILSKNYEVATLHLLQEYNNGEPDFVISIYLLLINTYVPLRPWGIRAKCSNSMWISQVQYGSRNENYLD